MKEDFLHKKLDQRKIENNLRELRLPMNGMVDFSSNDYLGIVRNKMLGRQPNLNYGSTGSRLLTGNYPLIEETEKFIAHFHDTETALIFNSGYDANLGLISSVAQKNDTILYDHLCHASIRDGIRLSFAQSFSFIHNDVEDLEKKLKISTGNIFVVTESVFSMDGDTCPLREIATLCQQFNANVVVDEAHATGVIGEKGEGLVQMLGLQSSVFARIHTFGKALGVHGAAVVGSKAMKDYLVNFARPFVYSTALPEQSVADILDSYKLFPGLAQERKQIQTLVQHIRSSVLSSHFVNSLTGIQGFIMPGNEEVKALSQKLQEMKIDARPILYPTVPKGSERLRIILHAFNSLSELDLLLNCLKNSC